MSKPTVPEVAPLVVKLYDRHSCGCCLHILLDDGNVTDADADFCIERAIEQDCQECITLAKLLRQMTKTQRKKLSCSAWRHA